MQYHQPPVPLPSPKRLGVLACFASLCGLCAKRFCRNSLSLIGILMTCSLSLSQGLPGVAASSNELGKKVEDLIQASGAETVAVSYYDLSTGDELLINPDISFHAASTMKVPVMMEIFRQAAAGKISLGQRIPIKNVFASIVDGSHYSLTAESDSEQSLYTRTG